jgi:ABC-type multidrug transport system, ATPase component
LKRNRDDPRSAAERDCIVERLIEDPRLQKCADVVVGNALSRGISGGQAKRVNIGISLVTRPRLLFPAEPTTG